MNSSSPKPHLQKLSQRIREARLALQISQEEAAFRAELSYTQYGRIERGQCTPGLDTLRRIESALGLLPDSLYSYLLSPAEKEEELPAEFECILDHRVLSSLLGKQSVRIVIRLDG